MDICYDPKIHDEWVDRLESTFRSRKVKSKKVKSGFKFKKFLVRDYYRGINSIIEVVVVKSDSCRFELTLDFGRSEGKRKPYGNILCVYGPLTEIRKFTSVGVVGWEKAFKLFQHVVKKIDYSSFVKVEKQFKKLRYYTIPKTPKVRKK